MEMGLQLSPYVLKTRPTSDSFLASIFTSSLNAAAKALVSVASGSKTQKWKLADHFRFMFMVTTWVVVWFLRVLMDWVPPSLVPFSNFLIGSSSTVKSLEYPLRLSLPSSSSSLSSSSLASLNKFDLVPYQCFEGPSVKGLGRALSQIFSIMNEMPATSRKYQFAMAMTENIMEENARGSREELLEVNRTALASAFERTSGFLYNVLHHVQLEGERALLGAWPTRIVQSLPLGNYLAPCLKYLNFCVRTVSSMVANCDAWRSQGRRLPGIAGYDEAVEYGEEVIAEKLGQELLWMTQKMVEYGGLDEAMAQWGYFPSLANLSLSSSPRVQSFFVKIAGIMFREMGGKEMGISAEVKFRVLVLWLPLLCHARNGLTYPALTSMEKGEIERAIDRVIGSLPTMDQEIVLSNWIKDYAISPSNWPNLQSSYDRWCVSTRELTN